ncbi:MULTISPECIES: hypothetical protein [Faecalibacterium]|uniref:hypothetical protein n=1 Tax=Faecalibacterium TaxID=216851 RepID=UPI0011C239AE|nr:MULTISPECIES: hypothetical protein [Faecalibacterium]
MSAFKESSPSGKIAREYAKNRFEKICSHYSTGSDKEKRRKQRNFDRFFGETSSGKQPIFYKKARRNSRSWKNCGKNRAQPKISQKSSRPASPHKTVQ